MLCVFIYPKEGFTTAGEVLGDPGKDVLRNVLRDQMLTQNSGSHA